MHIALAAICPKPEVLENNFGSRRVIPQSPGRQLYGQAHKIIRYVGPAGWVADMNCEKKLATTLLALVIGPH